MSVSPLFGNPKPQWQNASSVNFNGATLSFYAENTSNPQDTYTDSTGTTTNPNPLTLNARGEPQTDAGVSTMIYGTDGQGYKIVLKDSDGDPIWTMDNVFPGDNLRADLADTTDVAKGDALVGGKRTDTNAAAFTLHAYHENRVINVKTDYGTTSAAIDNAITDGGGKVLYFPEGVWAYAGTLDFSGVYSVIGDGKEITIFDITPSTGDPHVLIAPAANREFGVFRDFTIKGQATAVASGEYGLQLGNDTALSVYFANTVFRDIMIKNVGDHALYLERSIFGCSFYDIHAKDSFGDGINIADKSANKANANRFYTPVIRNCKQGIVVQASINNIFYGPWIEALAGETDATGKAIDINSSVGTVIECAIYDPYVEWNESTDPLLINLESTNTCSIRGGTYSIQKSGTTNPLVATSFIEITSNNDNTSVENVRLGIDSGTIASGVNNDATNSVIINVESSGAGAITTLIDDSTTASIVINNGVFGDTGSWTPSLEFGGATTGITYSDRSGRYLRIGKTVFFEGYFLLSSKGSATGAATVDGLPYTATSLPNGGLTVTRGQASTVSGYVQNSTTEINLFESDGTTSQDTEFTNTTQLRFHGQYTIT